MLKLTIILILFVQFNVFSIDFEQFDYYPLLVDTSLTIQEIESNNSGDIIVSGYNIIDSDPFNYTANTVILKSVDKGLKWDVIYTDSNETLPKSERNYYNIEDMKYLDDGKIFLFCSNGKVLYSPDDGITWQQDSFGIMKRPIQTHFIDSQNGLTLWYKSLGIGQVSTYHLYLTNDGGDTWNELIVPVADLLEHTTRFYTGRFHYFDDGTISLYMSDNKYQNDSLVESKPYLISTADNGKTWTKELFKLPVAYANIQFLNNEHIVLFGIIKSEVKFDNAGNPFGHDIILESFDRGITWDTLLLNIDTNINSTLKASFEYFDDKSFLFRYPFSGISYFERGLSKIIYLSPNNIKELLEKYGYTNSIDFIRQGDSLLVSSYCGYLFYVDFKNPITTVEIENELINPISIYPNPVGKQATIEFELSSSTTVNLDIYDAAGNKVQTLIAEQMPINKYGITWIPNNLPSGAYFIKLTTDYGTFNQKVIVK